MSEVKLLPCPFCGNDPRVREQGRLWYVFCECPVGPTAQGMTEARAWTAWNTRPAPDGERMRELEELLAACLEVQGVEMWMPERVRNAVAALNAEKKEKP